MGPFTFKKVYMLLHVPIGVYNRLQAVIEFISVDMTPLLESRSFKK